MQNVIKTALLSALCIGTTINASSTRVHVIHPLKSKSLVKSILSTSIDLALLAAGAICAQGVINSTTEKGKEGSLSLAIGALGLLYLKRSYAVENATHGAYKLTSPDK